MSDTKDDFGARQFSFGTQFKNFRAKLEKGEAGPFKITDFSLGRKAEETDQMKELTKDQTRSSLVNQSSPTENVDSSDDELVNCQVKETPSIKASFFAALKDAEHPEETQPFQGYATKDPWDLTSPDQTFDQRMSTSSKKRSISAQLTAQEVTPPPAKQGDLDSPPTIGIQALKMPRRLANTASKGFGLSLSASRTQEAGPNSEQKPVKNSRLQMLRNKIMKSQDKSMESDSNSRNTEGSRLQKIHLKSIQLHEEFEATQLRTFGAKYDLGKKLGEGMHAQVYLCFKKDDQGQTPYAVKLTREDDEEKKMAHRKEFAITHGLDHPNIVKSLELFDNDLKGEIHQVMQYVDGIEVLDSIAQQQNGVYTEHNAKCLFRQILQGIHYLHEHDVAHRDIKPQNILVTKDQKVFLMDFNVSSKKADSKAAFKMMTKTGTVAFSAPEIFTSSVYDEKVDIWSAGVVLYMMLTGKQPFNEENVALLVHQITHMQLDLLDEALMDVSSTAHNLIERMLEKNPADRLSAAECLAHPWLKDNDRISFGMHDTSSNGSFVLNRASEKLGIRRKDKLCGKLNIAQMMPVKNLMDDLLKNGLDLSHLGRSQGDSKFGALNLKKNNSLSAVIAGKNLGRQPPGAKESLDIISEEDKTPISGLYRGKDKSPSFVPQGTSSTQLGTSPKKESRKIVDEFFGDADLDAMESELSQQMNVKLSLKAKSVVVKTLMNQKYQQPQESPSDVVHEMGDEFDSDQASSKKKDVFSVADSVSN